MIRYQWPVCISVVHWFPVGHAGCELLELGDDDELLGGGVLDEELVDDELDDGLLLDDDEDELLGGGSLDEELLEDELLGAGVLEEELLEEELLGAGGLRKSYWMMNWYWKKNLG